jgi:hypothetical protein
MILLISAFGAVEITGIIHCAGLPWFISEIQLTNFSPSMASNCSPPVSASQVSGIVSVSHHSWPNSVVLTAFLINISSIVLVI